MYKRLLTLILPVILLTGCGSIGESSSAAYKSSNSFDTDMVAEEAMADYDSFDTAEMPEEAVTEGAAGIEVKEMSEKIIRNAYLEIKAEDVGGCAQDISGLTAKYNGYEEGNEIYSNSDSSRYGSLNVKIPAADLDAFLKEITDKYRVTSKRVTAENVTMEYADLDARIRALENERDTLERLLKEADDMEDTLSIYDKLSEVNYELDSLKSRMRTMDNRISYSAVTIQVSEPGATAVTYGFWDEVRDRFAEGIMDSVNFVIAIITHLPVIAIVIGIILFFCAMFMKIKHNIAQGGSKNKKSKAKAAGTAGNADEKVLADDKPDSPVDSEKKE
ncbi:MAG: DUF4349 domain-containing protein [Lachnospiraceae bacterium]|nr:DUF4349 domain-containing protein [Lachnospiraceae bacterium]